MLPDFRAGARRGGHDRHRRTRLRTLALDCYARRGSRRAGARAPRRKSPSGETIPRRGGSICRREPRNVALARRRVSRKIKPIT